MTSLPIKRQKLDDDATGCGIVSDNTDSYLLPLPLPIIHPSSFPIPDAPTEWSYRSARMSAPMVRVSTLPFRLLCRHYGADAVYSEELIAAKLRHCTRHPNPSTRTVDFLSPARSVVFSTYAAEPVVCQLGASNAADALRAAEVVAADVRAVDLNMGCPERFSTQGGMGYALLRSPDVAEDILRTLRRNLPSEVAVTCKIRLLERAEDTAELMRRLEATGVAAIGVHARRVPDRPRHRALTDELALLFSLRAVPCLYNGDLFASPAIPPHVQLPPNTSVLLGRGAMWNPSVFAYSPLPLLPVVEQYVRTAAVYGPAAANCKYVALEMLKAHCSTLTAYARLVQAKDNTQLAAALEALTAEARQRAAVGEVERKEEEAVVAVVEGRGRVEKRLREAERMRQLLYGPYVPPVVRWEERRPQSIVQVQPPNESLDR